MYSALLSLTDALNCLVLCCVSRHLVVLAVVHMEPSCCVFDSVCEQLSVQCMSASSVETTWQRNSQSLSSCWTMSACLSSLLCLMNHSIVKISFLNWSFVSCRSSAPPCFRLCTVGGCNTYLHLFSSSFIFLFFLSCKDYITQLLVTICNKMYHQVMPVTNK